MNKKIIYLNNGLGDIIMMSPVLTKINSQEFTLVLKNSYNVSIINYLVPNNSFSFIILKNKFSFITLFLKINFTFSYKNIYLPFASISLKNKIFLFNIKSFFRKPNSLNTHQVLQLYNFFVHHGLLLPTDNVSYSKLPRVLYDSKYVYIGLSCGIAEKHKVPSPSYLNQMLITIHNYYPSLVFVFCVVSSESAYINMVTRNLPQDSFIVHFDLGFNDVLSNIAQCKFSIVSTNGHGHMSSLTNIPTITYAGVVNPYVTGPFTDNLFVLSHSLSCKHCYDDGLILGCRSYNCMDSLPYSYLLKVIKEII